MFVLLFNRYGLSFEFFFYMLFVCSLIIATFVDLKHRIIPDEISIGGIIIGFLLNVARSFNLRPPSFSLQPILNSFLGIIIGSGIIYLSGFLFDLIYFKLLKKGPISGEKESMGFGDVKFLGMIGAFSGWQRAILTFFLAPFFGAVMGLINLLVKKDHTIPYGPFLSFAAIISLFWADKIIHLILFR
jgi:leader peptidase (prepilin peptidase)/N-methyltransferase